MLAVTGNRDDALHKKKNFAHQLAFCIGFRHLLASVLAIAAPQTDTFNYGKILPAPKGIYCIPTSW
jgi:hypothetical protein